MSSKKEQSSKVKSSKNKIAVITIGRWHPPHKGHEVLIQGTLVEATKLGADPFVWISPLQKHLTHPVPDKSNPLTVCSRFYYLDKMYPKKQHGQLTFLSDLNNISTEMEKELNCGSSALSKNERSTRVWRKLPTNWDGMSECQRMKYASIKRQVLTTGNLESYFKRYQSTRTAGVEFDNNDFLVKVEEKRRLPSYQCLKFLKKRGYTQVILLVGSDRLEAFKKYNQKSGENLFDKFNIDVAGAPRGTIGQGEQGLVSPLKMVRANSNDINSDTLDMMEGLLNDESNESKESKESKTVLTHDEQKRRSEKYSGTITRNTALKGEVVKFVDAVKIGTMTNFDCLCMMNEIRTVGDNTDTVYPKISEDDFMKIVYPQEVVPQEVVPDEYMNTFAITGPDKRRELRKQRGYGRKTRKKKRKRNRKTKKKRGGNKKTRRKKKNREAAKKQRKTAKARKRQEEERKRQEEERKRQEMKRTSSGVSVTDTAYNGIVNTYIGKDIAQPLREETLRELSEILSQNHKILYKYNQIKRYYTDKLITLRKVEEEIKKQGGTKRVCTYFNPDVYPPSSSYEMRYPTTKYGDNNELKKLIYYARTPKESVIEDFLFRLCEKVWERDPILSKKEYGDTTNEQMNYVSALSQDFENMTSGAFDARSAYALKNAYEKWSTKCHIIKQNALDKTDKGFVDAKKSFISNIVFECKYALGLTGGHKRKTTKRHMKKRKGKQGKTRKKRGGVYAGQIPPPIGTIIKRNGSNSFLRVTGYRTNLGVRAKPISNPNSPVIFISNYDLLHYYIHISEPNPQSSN